MKQITSVILSILKEKFIIGLYEKEASLEEC